MKRLLFRSAFGFLCVLFAGSSFGHVLQHFTHLTVARDIRITSEVMTFTYDCTVTTDTLTTPPEILDIDRNGSPDNHELGAFMQLAAEYLATDLAVFHDRQMLPLQVKSMEVRPDYRSFRMVISAELLSPVTPSRDEMIRVVDPAYLLFFPELRPQPLTKISTVPEVELVQGSTTARDLRTTPTPGMELTLRRKN